MLAAAMRATLSAMTFVYLVLVSGSCSGATPQAESAAVPALEIPLSEPARESLSTLTILQSRGEISQELQQAADRYAAEHPGVSIGIRTVGAQSDYNAALRARLVSGERVDLFHVFSHRDVLELGGRLESLDGMDWVAQSAGDVHAPMLLEEGLFGIPYSVEGIGLILNSAIFEAAGILPDSISTQEDLQSALSELRDQIAGGGLRAEFPELETAAGFPAQDSAYLNGQLAGILLSGEFESPQAVSQAGSLSFSGAQSAGGYIDLFARFSAGGRGWPVLLEVTQAAQLEDFAAQRVAVIQQSTWAARRIVSLNPDMEERMRLIPIPGAEERGYVYTFAPAFWAVNSASDESARLLAKDFLTWLYESGAPYSAASPYGYDGENALDKQLFSLIEQGRSALSYHREFPSDWPFASTIRRYLSEYSLEWEECAQLLRESWE